MGIGNFFDNFMGGLAFGMLANLSYGFGGRWGGGCCCGSFPMMGGFGYQSNQYDYMFDESYKNSFPQIDYSAACQSIWDIAKKRTEDYFKQLQGNSANSSIPLNNCNYYMPQYTMPFSGYYFSTYQSPYFSGYAQITQTKQAEPAEKAETAQSLEPEKTDAETKKDDTQVRRTVTPAVTTVPAATQSELTRLKGKHWTELTDVQMQQVYGNYTNDISVPYTGTVEKLNEFLKGKGVLEGKGQVFMEAQQKYGISAAALAAITVHESGNGKSNLARNKNNVGGVRISGSSEFRTFSSVDECIMNMASFLKSGYVNNNGRPLTKLYQINAKYCPTSDPTDTSNGNSGWAKCVARNMSIIDSIA